ncbi:MAG: hypothetical protein B7Y51_01760 [Burkholderiales bacterium 28-67-8]|nr:MAG: hypothetical protein B7Y51_01760 [Burkholderiales bacterium 28-67-8]
MSEGFATQLPSPKGNGQIRLWLKSAEYAKRLLLGDAGDPWVSAAHYLAYFSQAHALVKPDVAVLQVGDLYDSWAAAHAEWSEAVNKRRRPATALRKLIEPEAPRQVLAEVVEAVLSHLRGQAPLVLALPSPSRWIRHANQLTASDEMELTGDDVEDGAMYIADLLRSVSTYAISGVLLEEPAAAADFNAEDLSHYQSIVNVVHHYRWGLALRLPDSTAVAPAALTSFDAVITNSTALTGSDSGASTAVGCDVSAAFAAGETCPALAPGQFYFAEVPAGLRPESVLERLSALRGK